MKNGRESERVKKTGGEKRTKEEKDEKVKAREARKLRSSTREASRMDINECSTPASVSSLFVCRITRDENNNL